MPALGSQGKRSLPGVPGKPVSKTKKRDVGLGEERERKETGK